MPTHIKKNIPLIALLALFTFIFFYRLDYNTLASWDEGWYASIAREIVKTGDFMHLSWNGKPYYDHPPLGFWLMASSFKFFGISEFSVRFPSAILGLLSLVIIYKTAIELFKKKSAGIASALILGTSVWYTIRVRSGNLDAIFVFFYILTVYLALKSSKNFSWFPLTMLSFGALIMTKTLIGVSAFLLILFLNIGAFKPTKIKKNWVSLLLGILLFIFLVYPWYDLHFKTYPDFFQHHFINIGTRNKTLASYFKLQTEKPFFYLHMGIRKWYYLWVFSIMYLIARGRILKKEVFFLFLWTAAILYPFLTTPETELWHLIPVYLPISLLIAYGIYDFGGMILSYFPKVKTRIFTYLYYAAFITLSLVQITIFYKEIIPVSKYTPNDVGISKAANKYNRPIFLDDDFTPIAVFYSQNLITPLISLPDDKKTMVKFFQSDEDNFVMITRNWAVDNLKIAKIPYKLLEKNNSFSIVTKP